MKVVYGLPPLNDCIFNDKFDSKHIHDQHPLFPGFDHIRFPDAVQVRFYSQISYGIR